MKAVAVPQTKLPPAARTFVEQYLKDTESFTTVHSNEEFPELLFDQNAYRTMYSPTKTGKAEFCPFHFLLPGYQPVKKPRVDDICLQVHVTTLDLSKRKL